MLLEKEELLLLLLVLVSFFLCRRRREAAPCFGFVGQKAEAKFDIPRPFGGNATEEPFFVFMEERRRIRYCISSREESACTFRLQ